MLAARGASRSLRASAAVAGSTATAADGAAGFVGQRTAVVSLLILLVLACVVRIGLLYRRGATGKQGGPGWLPANVRKALPVAVACGIAAALAGWPSEFMQKYYSTMAAIITAAVCCEMSSLERFAVKCFLRGGGTVMGVAEAFGSVLVVYYGLKALTDQQLLWEIIMVTALTLLNATLQKTYAKISYAFLVATITFALVFYGYEKRGMTVAVGRAFSVFVGMGCALVANILVPLLIGDLAQNLSEQTIFSQTNALLKKVFVLVDFAFLHQEVHAAKDVSDIRGKTFQDDAKKYFGLDDPAVSLEALQQKAKGEAFRNRVEMDAEVAVMQTAVNASWGDMVFARWLLHLHPLPEYITLSKHLHPVFAQASALAHCTRPHPKTWRDQSPPLEAVRLEIQSLEALFSKVYEDFEPSSAPPDRVREVSEVLLQIVEKLERCDRDLQDLKKLDPGFFHRRAGPQQYRFEAFVQGIIVLNSELAVYTAICWRELVYAQSPKDYQEIPPLLQQLLQLEDAVISPRKEKKDGAGGDEEEDDDDYDAKPVLTE